MTRASFYLLLLAPAIAFGALNVDPGSTYVTPGVWCGNYPAAKSYAETNSIPLVLVWGNEGCTHCAALNNALSTPEALGWATGQNAVFCFVEAFPRTRRRHIHTYASTWRVKARRHTAG